MIDRPSRKHAARTSLTDMVNVAVRIEKDYIHSMAIDMAPEFQHGFVWGASLKELRFELQYAGWTALDFDKAIVERCGARWYHWDFGFIQGLVDQLIQEEDSVRLRELHRAAKKKCTTRRPMPSRRTDG